jgi:type IV secretion system protein VirB5
MSESVQPKVENPYLSNRREWVERYGGEIQKAKTWRAVALFALVLATVAVLGALSLAKKSEFVPYVVEMDKLGRIANVSFPTNHLDAKPAYIRGELAGWVQATRAVFTDGNAQRLMVEKSFAKISRGDPAFIDLGTFSKANWQRSSGESVSVEIIGDPMAITDRSWQVQWKEIVKSRNGEMLREEIWMGNFEIYLATPRTQKTLLDNPLGLFIRTISWTKQKTTNY